jgi:hypothetical protein
LRDAGVYIDDRAHCHGGNQCMKIGPYVIPFCIVAGQAVATITEPTDEDMAQYPILDITSHDWKPQQLLDQPFDMSKVHWDDEDNDYDQEAWKLRLRKSLKKDSPEYISRWCEQLYNTDVDAVKRTLNATTRYAEVEAPSSIAPLRHHEKRRFPQFRNKRIKDTFYTDTVIVKRDTKSA